MKRKGDVFDSDAERQLFATLTSTWSPEYVIIPQLPLSKIVEVKPGEISKKELEYFYKANLDLTLCKNNQPILTIEFDGIGRGFSRNGEYIQLQHTSDPYRKLKMDFKLRVTGAVGYPLVVLSFEETMPLDEDDTFTILDGIIGQFLSWQAFPKNVDQLLEDTNQEELEDMSQWQRNEYYQDLALQAELLSEMENDPISCKASEYQYLCLQLGVRKYGYESLYDPELPKPSNRSLFANPTELQARIEAQNRAKRIGCRCTVQTPKGTVTRTIWLRNFEAIGVSSLSLVVNLAEYVAFKVAYQLLQKDDT